MTILITGGTGYIGQALIRSLLNQNHRVTVLTRSVSKARAILGELPELIEWDTTTGPPPESAYETVDAVINLAGRDIAGNRWTEAEKALLYSSRVTTTKHVLAGAIKAGIKTLITASAIGYYDHRLAGDLSSESPPAGPDTPDFMSHLCQAWEAASEPPDELKTSMRRVIIRLGVVIGHDSRALLQMSRPIQWGLGASIGPGDQWMNWVHLDDVVSLFITALTNKTYTGVYNAVSPGNTQNKPFFKTLGRLLKRPVWAKIPSVLLHTALGEMATVLTRGQKVVPDRLDAGLFRYRDLNKALKDSLGIIAPNNTPRRCDRLLVRQYIPRNRHEIFLFFSDARNLERITPNFLRFKIASQSTPVIQKDTVFEYKLRVRGIPIRWVSHICVWNPESEFVDNQIKGPYAAWYHTHRFFEYQNGTIIEDEVYYAMPAIPLIASIIRPFIKRDVHSIFRHRQQVIAQLFR